MNMKYVSLKVLALFHVHFYNPLLKKHMLNSFHFQAHIFRQNLYTGILKALLHIFLYLFFLAIFHKFLNLLKKVEEFYSLRNILKNLFKFLRVLILIYKLSFNTFINENYPL